MRGLSATGIISANAAIARRNGSALCSVFLSIPRHAVFLVHNHVREAALSLAPSFSWLVICLGIAIYLP
jgi:hypothetical protein